jgi:hypothetical protein
MRLAGTTAPLPRKVWPAGVEPALSGARSRWDSQLPYDQSETPGGTRTLSLRVEGPVSSRNSTTGARSSGGRVRTCALAINSRASYRLDHAGTKEAEAAGLEPANGSCRLRGSDALPSQLGHASASGRSGSRESSAPKAFRAGDVTPAKAKPLRVNPQGPRAHPFSRRDTAPVAVLPKVAPAGVEPATFRLRGGSSAV